MMLLTLLVQAAAQTPATPAVNTRIGEPNAISVVECCKVDWLKRVGSGNGPDRRWPSCSSGARPL